MRSVKLIDKKSMCGYNNHCDRLVKLHSSCVKSTRPQYAVLFPWSNYASKYVEKLNYFSGNTVKKLEKTQNSTDRILRQNRIEMNQSAGCDSDQSATPLMDQSQPRVCALTDQSEAAWAGPIPYKSSRSIQFVITAISETENAASATDDIDSTSNSAYTTGSFQNHHSTFTDLTPSNCSTRMPRTSKPHAMRERSAIHGPSVHTSVESAAMKVISRPTTSTHAGSPLAETRWDPGDCRRDRQSPRMEHCRPGSPPSRQFDRCRTPELQSNSQQRVRQHRRVRPGPLDRPIRAT